MKLFEWKQTQGEKKEMLKEVRSKIWNCLLTSVCTLRYYDFWKQNEMLGKNIYN